MNFNLDVAINVDLVIIFEIKEELELEVVLSCVK
jgi:hypothetical protein